MRRLSRMNEWTLERLFGRTAPAAEEGLDEISWFVEDVQSAHPATTVDEATASAHVSAMLDTALSADNGDPVARPVSKAHGPAEQASGLPKLRRRPVLANLFASLAAKMAAGTVGVLTAVSGLAAVGALPDPAQSAAAKVASVIGIDIEDPDDDDLVTPDDDDLADEDELEDDDHSDDADDAEDEREDALERAEEEREEALERAEEEREEAADRAEDEREEAEERAEEARDEAEDRDDDEGDEGDEGDDDEADDGDDEAEERADFDEDEAEERGDFENDQAEERGDFEEDLADDEGDDSDD